MISLNHVLRDFPGGSVVKNLPVNAGGTREEEPWEEEMTTQASILAGKIPWTEKPCGYSPWDLKEWDTTERAHIPCFISEHR